jgi:hypothetical protein
MEVSGRLLAPVALSPGKELPVPILWESHWASKSRSGVEENFLLMSVSRPYSVDDMMINESVAVSGIKLTG